MVIAGQFKGETVRITNVSVDEQGRKKAACILANGARVNILTENLELIAEEKPAEPALPRSKASMPFMSGSTGSRSLNQTRSLVRDRVAPTPSHVGETLAECEICGEDYNLEERRGKSGKLTVCPTCSSL